MEQVGLPLVRRLNRSGLGRMSIDTLSTARRFAAALDAEDYVALADLLTEVCEYVTPKGTLVGRQAITASYRNASTWAKRNIQRVEYESAVRLGKDANAVITFIDHLEHAGVHHTYECEQTVYLDTRGHVYRIIHHELPGQREAVDLFLRGIGVTRDA
jgi:hypothetical protein